METLVKVKDAAELHRDAQSGTIVNTSSVAYNKYIEQRNKMKQQQERINRLENDVSELKELVNKMVNK